MLELIPIDGYVTAQDIAVHFGIASGPQKRNEWFYKKLHAKLQFLEMDKKIDGSSSRFPPRKYRRISCG